MPRKIYLASSWRNSAQPATVDALRSRGHDVYDFRHPSPTDHGFQWSAIDPDWQGWTPREYVRLLGHHVAVKGYRNDRDAMEWADTCVLLLPCGRSAHLEAGYFHGAGKDLFIYTGMDPIEPELMYKMATAVCISFGDLIAALGVPAGEYGCVGR